jgi:hypothetical protein
MFLRFLQISMNFGSLDKFLKTYWDISTLKMNQPMMLFLVLDHTTVAAPKQARADPDLCRGLRMAHLGDLP